MKLLFTLSIAVFATVAQAKLICEGYTESRKRVVLAIEETGKKDRQGFKIAQVSRLVFDRSLKIVEQVVDGCDEALLAGSRKDVLVPSYDGNLYVECAGDGDAGFMNLYKVARNKYQGEVHAPNGNSSLDMGDEEEMKVTCDLVK